MNDYFGRPIGNAPHFGGNFQAQPPQMRTNKIYVTSLEDALNRYAEPNTIIVYRHQDEKLEYEIMTDIQGKKSYKVLKLSDFTPTQGEKAQGTPIIPNDELDGLKSRIKALEDEILKNKKSGGLE